MENGSTKNKQINCASQTDAGGCGFFYTNRDYLNKKANSGRRTRPNL